MLRRLLPLCAVLAVTAVHAVTLTGETSQPTYSVFKRGEPVQLRFTVTGLAAGQSGLTLTVTLSDVAEQKLAQQALPVTADAQGQWQGTMAGRSDLLGYYQVTAKLSTGETLAARGSRQAGYLTYLVVTDPANRVRAGEGARFGLQGGFPTAFDMRPYLGVTWVLGGYNWGQNEPDRPGQFAAKRAQPDPEAAARREQDRALGVQPLFCLIGHIPKWAQQMKDGKPVKNVIADLAAWGKYCEAVGKAAAEDYPHLAHHVYQVTWEPVYPWNFEGTDQDLVRLYEVAYPALHKYDPKAVVIGPTGAGISAGDIAWNERLLQAGLGKYLDAFCIHPYIAQPPEEHNLVGNIRALREVIRATTGRSLEIYGTEQGFPTGTDPAMEKPQALWLTRSYLIAVGEGFKMNTAFYACDYPGEPGYGFFHNLVIEKQAWAPGVVSPKPVAGAFAAMTMLLEGHETVGPVEGLGPTTLAYAFERAGRVTLALWDYGREPHAVRLATGAADVEVCDWMGNGRPEVTSGGMLQLTVGPEPVYVRGLAPGLWGKRARKPVTLAATGLATFPGDVLKLPVTLQAPAGAKGPVTVTARLGEDLATARASVKLLPGKPTPATVSLTIPATLAAGVYPVQITAGSGAATWGMTSALVRLRDAVTLDSLQPLGDQRLRLSLRNLRSTPTAGELTVQLGGVPDAKRTLSFKLGPKQSAELVADFAAAWLEPATVYQARVTLREQGGLPRLTTRPVNFSDCCRAPAVTVDGDLGEWAGTRPVQVAGREFLVRQPQLYRGRDDLSAQVRYAWDATALYLAVDVTDDTYLQAHTGFDTWKGDCLQVACDPEPTAGKELTGNLLADSGKRTNTELDLALTSQGPQAYRTLSPDPAKLPVRLLSAEEARLAVVRTATGLRYEAALPWKTLGRAATPPADGQLGFALTVNDMDALAQLDPKAVGLFGGITPAKDPAQFGRLVLVDHPAPVFAPLSGHSLEAQGVLGQSQPATAEALPWTNCAGVTADAAGDLWAVSDNRVYHFRQDVLVESCPLPTGMRLARGDGTRLVCLSHEGVFVEFLLATKQARELCRSDFADGKPPREFALGPQGELLALGHDGTVRRWDRNGQPLGQVLKLTPGTGWWYCSLGVDPARGDLWVGSYYPDMKLRRFPAGATEPAETREGFATAMMVVDRGLWWLEVGGAAHALQPGGPRRAPGSDYTYYPTGCAPAADGGTWIACAQGLVHLDQHGQPTGRRVGGLGDPGLVAAGAGGTVLALLENSQRCARFSAGDDPNGRLAANSNEPWRVANGWSGRALGLGWMGDAYLVLDAGSKALWRFDPDHVAWGEKPWIRLTEEGALAAPRLLAVGDAQAFVLDGTRLRAWWLSDWKQPARDVPLPAALAATAVTALAAAGDGLLVAATPDRLVAFAPGGEVKWTQPLAVKALAADEDRVFAATTAGQVRWLDARSGAEVAARDGLTATALAVRGPWLYASDPARHAVQRWRVR